MSRIPTPPTIEGAPTKSQPLLQAVEKQLGVVPNLFRLTANSPAALEGYLGLNSALANGALDARTRERLAIAVAQINGCSYCLSAHTYLGKNLAKLDEAEIAAAREGRSADAKANAALRFAVRIVNERGAIDEADVDEMRRAGFNDAELVEIVAHVALNTLTNYINEVFATVIDFPVVDARAA